MFGYTLIKTSELENLRKIEYMRDIARMHDESYKKNQIPEWVRQLAK